MPALNLTETIQKWFYYTVKVPLTEITESVTEKEIQCAF